MSGPMSETHITTIGPVRLEPLPDGRYMVHIEQPVTPAIDVEKLAHQVAKEIKYRQRDSAQEPDVPFLDERSAMEGVANIRHLLKSATPEQRSAYKTYLYGNMDLDRLRAAWPEMALIFDL